MDKTYIVTPTTTAGPETCFVKETLKLLLKMYSRPSVLIYVAAETYYVDRRTCAGRLQNGYSHPQLI